eukprot:13875289-Heterocapsa_arctica.AAC.1
MSLASEPAVDLVQVVRLAVLVVDESVHGHVLLGRANIILAIASRISAGASGQPACAARITCLNKSRLPFSPIKPC